MNDNPQLTSSNKPADRSAGVKLRRLTGRAVKVEPEPVSVPPDAFSDGKQRDAFVWHPAAAECGGPGSEEYAKKK